MSTRPAASGSSALHFVLIMGLVNLFGDMTYEGGASINGPFLGKLGADAALISIIAGGAEFLGYALRPVAGYIADRTGRYWPISFVGYVINLFAVPAMALAGSWQLAAVLIVAERVGRAIRKPPVEAMLSYTTGKLGKGWAFGLNTALDETGATLGPLIAAAILFFRGSYQLAYALLLISSILALVSLLAARLSFPLPERIETEEAETGRRFSPAYWLFMLGGGCFAAGLLSYELISYFLTASHRVPAQWMPVALAFATGFGVFANLALGRLYDRFGPACLYVAVLLSALFTPLLFAGSLSTLLVALPLLGIGYATQDTLMKAIIAGLLPEGKRGLAFGLFYIGYGLGWLIGSVVVGSLFDRSHMAVVVFAVSAQCLSIPMFYLGNRSQKTLSRSR